MAKEKIQPNFIETKAPEQNDELRTHTVAKGDSLLKLSAIYLGALERYTEIKQINKLPDDRITVGQILIIPDR
ncbi:MAG: hypothetical protein CVU97_01515 [Firmicutes bacterium HGW-Firmicutes-21]|nr:MAG: hypothetical protein CVU97_01515 [Firmicutes bacterium HGW-Firmicutes-21]